MDELEIIEAIKAGKKVHWSNEGYKVILQGQYSLYTIFESNQSMCALMPSEYKDCFVSKNKSL